MYNILVTNLFSVVLFMYSNHSFLILASRIYIKGPGGIQVKHGTIFFSNFGETNLLVVVLG